MLRRVLKHVVYLTVLYLALNGNYPCEIIAKTYFLFALLCAILALNSITIQKCLREYWFSESSIVDFCFVVVVDIAIIAILLLSGWYFFSIIYFISLVISLYTVVVLALRG